ncbi:TPA: hypothetical protein H2A59_002414 [Salmonella enterica]|nr:hypothetical protein [Salmonella enterica]
MKLSPEAKQAINTAIEQLRLLLVNDTMDTTREEVGRHLEAVARQKTEKRPHEEAFEMKASELFHKPSHGKNKCVVLYVPQLVLEVDY